MVAVEGRVPPGAARVAARHRDRRPVRCHPGRWRRGADVPGLRDRAQARPAQGRADLREGRHRGRRRSGGRGQRHRGHRDGRAARAGPAHLRDGGDPARRVPAVRPAAGPAAAGALRGHRVGAARRVLPGDDRAADPQPAVRAAVGAAAAGPEVLPVRGIAVFAAFGVYASGASQVDLVIMLVVGVLGLAMRLYDIPVAPVLIAVILGPLAEYSLRDAMGNSDNDPAVLVSSPITVLHGPRQGGEALVEGLPRGVEPDGADAGGGPVPQPRGDPFLGADQRRPQHHLVGDQGRGAGPVPALPGGADGVGPLAPALAAVGVEVEVPLRGAHPAEAERDAGAAGLDHRRLVGLVGGEGDLGALADLDRGPVPPGGAQTGVEVGEVGVGTLRDEARAQPAVGDPPPHRAALTAGQRDRDGLAVVGDALPRAGGPDHLDRLAQPGERAGERHAVQSLDHLGAGRAEPEQEPSLRHVVQGQGGLGDRDRRAGADLDHPGTEPDAFGAGGEVPQRGRRVGPPRLGDPAVVEAQLLGLDDELDGLAPVTAGGLDRRGGPHRPSRTSPTGPCTGTSPAASTAVAIGASSAASSAVRSGPRASHGRAAARSVSRSISSCSSAPAAVSAPVASTQPRARRSSAPAAQASGSTPRAVRSHSPSVSPAAILREPRGRRRGGAARRSRRRGRGRPRRPPRRRPRRAPRPGAARPGRQPDRRRRGRTGAARRRNRRAGPRAPRRRSRATRPRAAPGDHRRVEAVERGRHRSRAHRPQRGGAHREVAAPEPAEPGRLGGRPRLGGEVHDVVDRFELGPERPRGEVVALLQRVDRGVDARLARLELQRQVERVEPGLVQVAAVEPQVLLLGGLPHVALLALPGTGVLGRVRAEAPHLADLVRDVLADDVGGEAVHRPVAGGEHDEVGVELGAVGEPHPLLGELLHLPADQLHLAVGDELGGADVDVVARAAAQVLHEQAGVVVAEVQLEPGLLQPPVVVRVDLAGLVVGRLLEGVHDPVRQRREDHVGGVGVDARLDRALGVEVPEAVLHQRVGLDDVGGGALHHGDVGAVLPQRPADVERGVVRPDHHDLLAPVGVRAGVLRRVLHLAPELLRAREGGDVRLAGDAERDHQLARAQGDLLARLVDDDAPPAGRLVELGAARGGGAPVVQLHDPRVELQPVADLVLRREHRPVVRELQVRQVVVPDRVVQGEALVALAPRVAGPLVALDDDRLDAELAQPGAERDAALAAADDHDLGVAGAAQLGQLGLAALLPRDAVRVGAVLGAERAVLAHRLLVALELVEGGQEGPRLPVDDADVPGAAPDGGLEGEPPVGDTTGLGRLGGQRPVRRVGRVQGVPEQVTDAVVVLDGLQVPGERDQVAPVALVGEQRDGAVDVTGGQGVGEGGEPALRGRACRRLLLRGGHGHLLRAVRHDRGGARRPAAVVGATELSEHHARDPRHRLRGGCNSRPRQDGASGEVGPQRALLPRLDGHLQGVAGGRQRAGGVRGERARQVHHPVQVHLQRPVRRRVVGAQDAAAAVGGVPGGGVAEVQRQAAVLPGQRHEPLRSTGPGERDLADRGREVLQAGDDGVDRHRPRRVVGVNTASTTAAGS
ncbi:hypothetical protein L7F22_000088 [Adiantum nelumboides]|nr:hypothetical protein [Adiantum nelumboides]